MTENFSSAEAVRHEGVSSSPGQPGAMLNDQVAHNAREIFQRISANMHRVMRGQATGVRILLAAFAAGGHVLLEDVPGTGKTTMAKALAASIDADFKRVQFTPDLLPTDILGVSLFDQREQIFRFQEGPIFTHILLADEINRASPRTQSALLEAMAENQVSIEGTLYRLNPAFFVIATQNPLDFHGTYPLPESQMDRFAVRFSLGYVTPEDETAILTDQAHKHPLADLSPCASLGQAFELREAVSKVRISDELRRYIVDLVTATRTAEGVKIGASPRASIMLMKCAQALSLIDGQAFVTPDRIQEMAVPVVAHRLMMEQQAQFSGLRDQDVVRHVLDAVPVPA